MKFNVEMDKREMRRYLDKPEPVVVMFRSIGKGMNRACKNFQKACKHKPLKTTMLLLVIFIALLAVVFGMKSMYKTGYRDADLNHHFIQVAQQKQQTSDYFEDKTLKDTASWFAKKVLLALGNNLHILFMVIGIAWLIHGVGFRLI